MKTRVLGIALVAVVLPATVPAQHRAADTLAAVTPAAAAIPAQAAPLRLTNGGVPILPMAVRDARLAPDSISAFVALPAVPISPRWVDVGKWTLLATAVGFSAYGMMHGRGEGTDPRAQIGIAGAYVSLLGSAGLFIYDLRDSRREPGGNIPFEVASRTRGSGEVTVTGVGADR